MAMYRQYEDPHSLEERLQNLEAELKENPENYELAQEVAELKERINFAWQDDEDDAK